MTSSMLGRYDYSKVVYTGIFNKVIITCRVHGDYKQSPVDHLNGHGCAKCAGCYSPTTDEFIQKAKVKHGNKYDYSKVNYTTATKKIIIICKQHGDFAQTPNNHLNGHGCTKCSGRYSPTTNEFIQKAKVKHGEKYEYSKVEYTGNKNKVIITCRIHGDFEQSSGDHLCGAGCPKCGRIPKNKAEKKYETT